MHAIILGKRMADQMEEEESQLTCKQKQVSKVDGKTPLEICFSSLETIEGADRFYFGRILWMYKQMLVLKTILML